MNERRMRTHNACERAILTEKGIRHRLDDRRRCGHDWNYWRHMLPYYLSTI
jgi:esterase/lipase superfamily enzyme